ncbi:DNA translocase FtsK [Lactiplantibacillus pingfangensis]|uniref:DNA translocase FtsK n=1 Tax=Lactiplantibacillus pingfangensis TaxID=2559915 RepID=UPI0010F9F2CB|nr:DNA translocase FtsK [Lactiplantibacillus pingfangensis]
MNHYDGPAFYRKYRDYITKEPTSAATSQVAPAQSQPASAAASSAPRSAAAAYSAVSPKRQVASAAATSAEPFNGVTHGDFHPTHIPAQLTRSKAAVGVAMQSDETDYLEVETSLYKPIDSYFLFTTADGNEAADSETAEIAAVAVPVSMTATVVFQPSVPTRVEPEVVVASAPTVVFEPTSVAEEQPSEAAASSDTDATESSATTVVAPTSQSVTSQAESDAAQSAAVELASLTATPESTAADETPESALKPSHGLGLSLDAIMTEEHNAQAELALFKEKASDEAEVNSAGDEPSSHAAADESRTDDDDELYQPVGVRPRSEATPQPTSTATTSLASVQSTTAQSAPASDQPTEAEPTSAVHSGTSAAPVLADKALAEYHLPPLDLLKAPVIPDESEMDDWIESKASALDESLDAFGVNANVVDWTVGPTVTQFQVKLERGVKVSKITNLNDDLKLALAAKDIRIEAPIPGRNTVGIEIPNKTSRPVMLSEVLNSQKFKDSQSPLTVALGVDLFGQPQVTDLRKMPHGLIAGATGSGKSVFINSILVSLLYKANPQEVKLLLIDPKAVELAPYDKVPHLLAPVISEPKAASAALKWVVDEMDNRYEKLAAGGARNIEQFNAMAVEHHEDGLKMPYIVIVIDELADLMMVASSEVQDYIARITQKARAAGIHLLVATQRPSVDVVTGLIKNNIPTRIAFMVASQIDSRTILDTSGAERLLGRGDMLYLGNGQSTPIRLQGTYVESEIDAIAQFVRDQAAPHYEFQPDRLVKHEEAARNQDELMPEVLAYLADEDTVSTSKLQRTFSVGYNRAANLIDDLEQRNYVSPAKGSKPRDVYFTAEDLTKLQANS